jgi:hypothetical protein
MTARVGQCKLCEAYMPTIDERLPEHKSIKTGEPCRGRIPKGSKLEDYSVGFDSDPWVYGGGLPERNRNKF